jgi:hypothetical protein
MTRVQPNQIQVRWPRQCPFYGMHAIPSAAALMGSGGNQCALITDSYAPCRLEIDGRLPILEDCEFHGSGVAIDFARFAKFPFGEREK